MSLDIPSMQGRAPLVLVVEDDADCRDTIGDTLRDTGYDVLEATDGEHAMRLLLADDTPQVSIILLDLVLPGMSGQELYALLKSDSRLARIPVILTSAGKPNGADNAVETVWLAKPFDAARLLALVKERCVMTGSE